MRVLSRILVSIGIVLGLAASTYAQQTLSCGAPQDSFTNAAIVDSTNGTPWALQSNLLYLSWQTSFAVNPAAVQIDLQGSLDNTNWASIDSTTTVTGALRYVSGSSRFIRARVISHTTGSGMTITFNCTKAGGSSGYSVVENEASGLIRRNIVNFVGNGIDCVDDTSKTTCTISGLAGAAYGTVEDEGIALTQRSNLNFVGAGITCADTGGKTVCTISGGGSTGYATIQEEGASLTQRTVLNFVGSGATCADSGGITVCTISGGGASFPLQGGTGCTVPEHGFTADTDAGLCLNAANDVRIQTAPLTTALSSAIVLQSSAVGINNYNVSGIQNAMSISNNALSFTLNGVLVVQAIGNPPSLTFGTTAAAFADPIKFAPNTTNGNFTGTITSQDLTGAKTWTFPDASGNINLTAVGTAAPSSAACDSTGEVGSLYTQSGNLATVNGQTFVCMQLDGTPIYAWQPVGHLAATTHPATCSVGNMFFDTNASAGSNLELCTAANTWTVITGGGGGGFTSPGLGIVVDTVGDGTLSARSLVGGEGILITNPSGTSGNPTIAVDTSVVVRKGSGTADPPASCGDTGDTFQLGDLYYETDAGELSTCTAIDTWLCLNCASIDPSVAMEFTEECLTGNNTSGGMGSTGLTAAAFAAGTAVLNLSASSLEAHPGLCSVSTTTTDNGGGAFTLINSQNGQAWGDSWDSESWKLDGIFRMSAVTQSSFWFGVSNTAVQTSAASMIGVERDTDLSHTFFVFKICNSATAGCASAGDDTAQDSELSTIVPTANVWFRVRLSFDAVLQKFSGRINDETPVTFCASGCNSTITSLPVVAMVPTFSAQTRDTTAKQVDMDYMKLRMDFISPRY